MVPTVTYALAVESRRVMSLTTTGRVTGLARAESGGRGEGLP